MQEESCSFTTSQCSGGNQQSEVQNISLESQHSHQVPFRHQGGLPPGGGAYPVAVGPWDFQVNKAIWILSWTGDLDLAAGSEPKWLRGSIIIVAIINAIPGAMFDEMPKTDTGTPRI